MSAPIAAAISQDSRQLQDRQLQQPLHRQIQASDDASVNNLDSKMHRDNCLTQETIRSMRIRSVTTSPHLTGLDLSCNNAQRHQNQQRFKSAVHERRREHQSSKCSQDKASKKQSTLPKHSKHNSSHNKPAVKKHASQHEKGRGKHSKKQQQKERKDDRHRSFRRATFHKKGKIYMLAHQDWYTQYRRQRGPKGVMRKLTLDNTRRRKAMITFLPSSYSRINDRLSDDIDDDGNVIVDPNAGPGVVSFDNSYKGDLESQTGDENEDDTELSYL
ncbi:hypothetical protein FBU30_011070 [Linnemannia zychae]|nr:hypothetical protein FBU30_011070 [Linnemannia zychae]